MAFIEPNSHIKIYRGIESSGKRRPIFKTQAAQTAYFTRHLAYDYTPTTHVKYTTSRVRVGLSVAQLLGCNYLSFVNPAFGNKVYYANIVGDPIYINNDCTEIEYAVDYAQTDMFNVTLEPCYIDREHLSDEDYTKSQANAFDPSIMEFWTSEPLPVDKDLEKDYSVSMDTRGAFMAARRKWSGTEDYDKIITLVAFAPVTPPSTAEADWFNAFLEAAADVYSTFGFSFAYSTQSFTVGSATRDAGVVWPSKKLADALGVPTPWAAETMPKFQSDFKRPYNIVAFEDDTAIFGTEAFFDHLTLWGATDNIIAIHALPAYMVFEMFKPITESHSTVRVLTPPKTYDSYTLHNTKLVRYPFSYIRAIAPNGETKEFQFERCTDVTEAEEPVTDFTYPMYFDLLTDYNAQPIVSLIPLNYKIKTPGNSLIYTEDFKPNIFERLDFQTIPQVPYTTDAFLAGLAAANADMLSSRTLQNQQQLLNAEYQVGYDANDVLISGYRHGAQTATDIVAAGADTLGAAASLSTGNVAGATEGVNAVAQRMLNVAERQTQLDRAADNWRYNQAKVDLQKNMMADSANLALSQLEGNAVYKNFKDTKAAYVCDKYTPSSGTGTYFYNDASVMDFIILVVALRTDILKKYDMWFNNYGYNSGRYGVPRVMAYMSNAETGRPHFAPSGVEGESVTYIKTSGASVKAPSKTSETFWETMLDNGIQWIKGEDLT